MKNIFFKRSATLWLLAAVLVSFTSCEKLYQQESAKVEKAMAEKYKEKKKQDKNYPKNIDEALSTYNFSAARDYLGCYTLSDEALDGMKKTTASNSDLATEIARCRDITFDHMNYKVTIAEITYVVSKGDTARAKQVATEANCIFAYQDFAASRLIPSFVENKEYEKALNILKCPICGDVYSSCSSRLAKAWSAAYSRYNANADQYNQTVKDTYSKTLSQPSSSFTGNIQSGNKQYLASDSDWQLLFSSEILKRNYFLSLQRASLRTRWKRR